jgi:nitrate/nitrite-specific signal transduction histidine kinase
VHGKRERIAQEMHDSLGHVLALVAVQAAALGGDRKIRVAVVDDDGDREDPSDKVVHETR